MQDQAIDNAISIEGAKVSSAGLLFLCSFFASSPLAPIVAMVAALGYLGSVAVDKMLTGKACFVPLCRLSAGDALAVVGAFQGGAVDESVAGLLDGHEVWSEGYKSRPRLEREPLQLPTVEPLYPHHAKPKRIEPQVDDVVSIPAPIVDPWEDPDEAMVLGQQLQAAGLAVVVEPDEPPATAKTALSRLLDNPFESRAIFGAQRTGKSFLAAIAAQRSGANIYHINLASFGDEDSVYYRDAKLSITGDVEMLDHDEASQLIAEAMGAVEAFFCDKDPSILVVDEWAIVGSTMNRHSSILTNLMAVLASRSSALSSAGKKRRKAIWAISPKLVAGELTQAGKAIKGLKLCYVSIAPNRSVLWEDQKIQFSSELYEQLQRNYSFPHPGAFWQEDRICYVDNGWVPVGDL